MKRIKRGFTLIELVVVTLIMGILASMSMPYYYKTVEASKATDALAIGQLLGSAYRMFRIDNPNNTLSGDITAACNSGGCNIGDGNACNLVRCNYVAPQDWTNASYKFSVGGSCGGAAACVDRVDTGGPYDNWGYSFNTVGGCTALNGAPPCPKF